MEVLAEMRKLVETLNSCTSSFHTSATISFNSNVFHTVIFFWICVTILLRYMNELIHVHWPSDNLLSIQSVYLFWLFKGDGGSRHYP